MTSMSKVLILHAIEYDFNDDEGQRREGVKISYIQEGAENEEHRRGMPILQVSGGRELWAQLASVPGVYEMDWRQRPGRNNRPMTVLVGLRPLPGSEWDWSCAS